MSFSSILAAGMAPIPLFPGTAPTSPLEIVGTLFGALGVWLAVKERAINWAVQLVSIVAYALLFVGIKLYADAILQGFFFLTSVQGWYWWSKKDNAAAPKLALSWLTNSQRIAAFLLTAIASALIGWLFSARTDAHLPYWDAGAAGVSVTAQCLQMRKKIDCWALWTAVDIVYVGIYVYKKVYLTAGLYALFVILAILGWRAWQKSLRDQQA